MTTSFTLLVFFLFTHLYLQSLIYQLSSSGISIIMCLYHSPILWRRHTSMDRLSLLRPLFICPSSQPDLLGSSQRVFDLTFVYVPCLRWTSVLTTESITTLSVSSSSSDPVSFINGLDSRCRRLLRQNWKFEFHS